LVHRGFFVAKMIEGGHPRHICIDLTHNTSQSKNFDTAQSLQFACQVLLMVILDLKLELKDAIETEASSLTAAASPPLLLSINCIRLLIISIASDVHTLKYTSNYCANFS
jgi:hypothetical protein